ncbi:MAG: ABC transporter ATP-binding protein [Lachnospiraceae bacterium]|nr:ABC transporter ATP-binding protein [Lachnospiraceae bacterium]
MADTGKRDNSREVAICAENITKMYKLYDKPGDRVKEALGFSRKKKAKEHYALTDVDLTIYKGETVGIIGTNGSGKSTILKIITGVLNPTKGNISVNGRISALLELGAGFNMEYNGIENIYLNGTMMGFSKKEIDDKLEDILAFADIGEYVYQPCKTYSSGMFVRLAFAVAINIEPEILIVDEALSVGDVFFQAKCYHKFDEFKAAGKTILFVSHDLSSIAKYCDRVVLLNKGVKLDEGEPKKMIDIYKQVLVGQYQVDRDDEHNLLDDDEVKAKAALGSVNPELLEYGTMAAKISNYYVTDKSGTVTTAVIKGEKWTLHYDVEFTENIKAPIFAFTIKTIRGTEVTGTNSMFERAFLDGVRKGTKKTVTFTQNMDLQGGEYLLSLGVTGYEDDKFQVYHRLYDVLNVTVISDKDTVGYFDMNSKVEVK